VINDIGFDPLTPIAARLDGKPNCSENAEIDKAETAFAFLPLGCTGAECNGVRALVLPTDNVPPIPDGATLYSCEVAIAADAPAGVYPLVATMPMASGPHGEVLTALTTAGSIDVTPTVPACSGDCDGDHIVAINELLIGVNIATGGAPISACAQFDSNGDHAVTVDELVSAVKNALSGCPSS
jgi:hypothetical protein